MTVSKLTPETYLSARRRLRSGLSLRTIAEDLQLSDCTVQAIKKNKIAPPEGSLRCNGCGGIQRRIPGIGCLVCESRKAAMAKQCA